MLQKDLGGRLDGTPWSSEELVSGKIIILFHVDPDESELNNHVTEALKTEKFSTEKTGSVVVVNMAASWLPDVMINKKLKTNKRNIKQLYM